MRPVLVTDHPELLDNCLRIAAAVGVEIELVPDVGTARARWGGGSLVLVGADVAQRVALAAPTRRSGVIVVAVEEPDAAIWQAAVSLGAEHVAVFPAADSWLAARFADAEQGPARSGLVVGVRGAHGGIGTSTIAAGMSLVAARNGHRTLLIDGDCAAGGLDVLLGAEDLPGMRWPEVMSARGRIAPSDFEGALPHLNGVSVLSWDRGPLMPFVADAVEAVMATAIRGFDVTIVDLGRETETCFDTHLRSTVLVVAASALSVAAAHRLLQSSARLIDPLHLVVRGSTADADLVAESLGRPVTATCPDEGDVRRAAGEGELPAMRRRGSLTSACTTLMAALHPQSQAA
jgi:secretion/DNA translocation related CpaE-like protein